MAGTSERMIYIRGYERLKKTVEKLKPESMVYAMQSAPLLKPPIVLRLIFTSGIKQYVFLDFPAGNNMRETKIPIKYNKYGEAYLDDDDIRKFIIEELGIKDSDICSMEVLGYY